jgi:hypothetical protein
MKIVEPGRRALLDLGEEFVSFKDAVTKKTPDHETPKSRLDKLNDLCEEGNVAVAALLHSLWLVEKTGLDVVDMESRMKGESGRLADVLKDIGHEVYEQYFVKRFFRSRLVALDECAQLVAAALYPSAVQGLNKANSKLWEFQRRLIGRYELDLAELERDGQLTASQKKSIQTGFGKLGARFEDANSFLNELALHRLGEAQFRSRIGEVKQSLKSASSDSQALRKRKAFKEFRGTLKGVAGCAREVAERLHGLRVPLFPKHGELEELTACIDKPLYSRLSGLQLFALLNITARMRQIKVGTPAKHLLSRDFDVRVEKVFPDRIYLDVDASFVKEISNSDVFEDAGASLHAFNDGSFKQKTYSEGNLQVSYEKRGSRCKVDADIDLYRNPLAHLFGEVLVNHLTGGKTDQYRVLNTLSDQQVLPIGGFRVAKI